MMLILKLIALFTAGLAVGYACGYLASALQIRRLEKFVKSLRSSTDELEDAVNRNTQPKDKK